MQENQVIKPTLYLIPGYSADGRVFGGLARQGLEFEVLEHPVPYKNETLEAYVRRIGEGIDTSKPFYLGGLSMGGMITVELCKYLNPEKIILISTTKDEAEFPWYIQLNRWLPLWRITPAVLLKW